MGPLAAYDSRALHDGVAAGLDRNGRRSNPQGLSHAGRVYLRHVTSNAAPLLARRLMLALKLRVDGPAIGWGRFETNPGCVANTRGDERLSRVRFAQSRQTG